MAVTVLLAGTDFEVQKLVVDVVEMTYNEVEIERALDFEALHEKLDEDASKYNVFIFDGPMVKAFNEEMGNMDSHKIELFEKKVILISDSEDDLLQNGFKDRFTHLIKPFSLDAFQDLIKETYHAC